MITISTAGVIRCCLASIGGDYVGEKKESNWKVFENPHKYDTDTCEYCGEEFTLIDSPVKGDLEWTPTIFIHEGEGE